MTPKDGLSLAEWKTFASGANQIARAVFEETGLRTVFHHHCAGYVETPEEIATLLDLTDPQRLGLVFDTGHYSYGAGEENSDMEAALNRFKDRIWYVHLKDVEPAVAQRSRVEQWDYFTALRRGVFCELGKGCVDFPALLRWLSAQDYKGYCLVEQDILPGKGTPKESARRNREYPRIPLNPTLLIVCACLIHGSALRQHQAGSAAGCSWKTLSATNLVRLFPVRVH